MATEDRFPDLTREHRATWAAFITFLKVGTALTVATLALMAVFLV